MKKISAIILIAVLSACSNQFFSEDGMYGGSYEPAAPGEEYMTRLSTDLIPDFLLVLESALTYDTYGYYATSTGSKDYVSGGKSLRTVGTRWTVNSKKKVKGTEIECLAADKWSVTWKGKYGLNYYYGSEDEYAYETTVSMTATMIKETTTNHFDWTVVVNGDRTERKGYACTFSTAPDMTYSNTKPDSYVWDMCNGSASMLVTKNGEKVDLVRMDYLGETTRYFRGL